MANIPQFLKNMNLYVDGKSYAGRVEEITLPKLAVDTEEFNGGGLDAPIEIDMGMQKLEASFLINEYDPALFAMLGLLPGNFVNVSCRGVMVQGEEKTPVVANLMGAWKEIDMGSWKRKEKSALKVLIAPRVYTLLIDGIPAIHIDIPNYIRRIGLVDFLEDERNMLGI
ncbi:phage major tail tube protein [Algicola sagamiensis]|uniref:phage major tail tube protein n=1 Tax=Algicola sagamiensis TaxID=163869 RepID=UPI00036F1E8B|nr:phage major tail tube protein [Algicola sagamiensis]